MPKLETGSIEALTKQLKTGKKPEASAEFLVPAIVESTVICSFQGNVMKCVETQTPPRCPGAVEVILPDGGRMNKGVDCGPPQYGSNGAECDCEWSD